MHFLFFHFANDMGVCVFWVCPTTPMSSLSLSMYIYIYIVVHLQQWHLTYLIYSTLFEPVVVWGPNPRS